MWIFLNSIMHEQKCVYIRLNTQFKFTTCLGRRDRTLAVKIWKKTRKSTFCREKKYSTIFFLHISSTHAKILGETNFHKQVFPRSGSKAKDRERKKRGKKQKVGHNNGQLRIATPPRKAAWAIIFWVLCNLLF